MVHKFSALSEIPLWRDWDEEVTAMYAIFETGGKQYKAQIGDIVQVEKLDADVGKTVSFDVLVVADGDDVQIGTPLVAGAKVKAKVTEHGKDKKIVVYKFKPKRKYRKKQGHRQPYSRVKITSIALAKEKADATAAKAEVKPAVAKTTAAKKPAAKTTAAKKPAAKATTAKTTAAKKPAAAKATTAKTTAAKKPAANTTAAKTTAAKKPAAKKPAAKTTAAKTTTAKKPAAAKKPPVK